MKTTLGCVLAFFLSAICARADHPATEFFILKTSDIPQIDMKDGVPSPQGRTQMNTLAVCSGYFQGESCRLTMTTKDFQIHVKAIISTENKTEWIAYSFSLYSQKDHALVFRVEGNTPYNKELTIPDARKGEYTILFSWANLKS